MTSVFADVSSPALKCLCKVCEGGVAVPWWGFVPLAMAQCRALSSATDSLRQLQSHTAPQTMSHVMERSNNWTSGIVPCSFPLVTLSPYPVTSWQPLIEPTACKPAKFKTLPLHSTVCVLFVFVLLEMESCCRLFLHPWVNLSQKMSWSWILVWNSWTFIGWDLLWRFVFGVFLLLSQTSTSGKTKKMFFLKCFYTINYYDSIQKIETDGWGFHLQIFDSFKVNL